MKKFFLVLLLLCFICTGAFAQLCIPIFFGNYLHVDRPNTISYGIPLQLGLELDLGSFFSLAILGDAKAGIGHPKAFEFNFGGTAEMFFFYKTFGIAMGYGMYSNTGTSPFADESLEYEDIKTSYTRFAIIFRTDRNLKFVAYVDLYNSWNDRKMGFGFSFNIGYYLFK